MSMMGKDSEIPKLSIELCTRLLTDLENARRPVLEAIKCSLDNAKYSPSVGFLTPGSKKVRTELNVSSVQKMSRAIFMLEVLLRNIETGAVNTKRELYYIAKGEVKHSPDLKPLDFQDQSESDAIIDFICEILECYREELNCYANDRGGQTYSNQLVVTETLPDGTKLNGPASLRALLLKRKLDFVRTLAEKLLTYALGRGLEPGDKTAVDKIATDAAKDGYRFSSLIQGVAASEPFRKRKVSS